ncbi:universal stress protein [Pseudonocardia sp. GCM10023141]|uniref:universal stress protein n=1 Tax=Pseudonocardia sp. GCM10023141 TaxID=3252653 RepID=UPI00360B4E08
MPPPDPRAVVVGVDGSGSADDAVCWAAAEAAARRCPLHLVHAQRPPLLIDPYGVALPVDGVLGHRTAAAAALRDARSLARDVASEITVSTRLSSGPPTRALLQATQHAQLLVIGGFARSSLYDRLARSVSSRTVTQARCPVAVIRRDTRRPGRGGGPRVVVGVGRGASGARTIEFAFRAARQRGVPLVAVHAWTPDLPADLEAVSGSAAAAADEGRAALEQALASWQARFGDVAVSLALRHADPAHAVIGESAGAALLVVGARERRGLRRTLLGSVSRTVLQQAGCPVVIVQNGHGTAPGPTPAARHGAGP